jgi:hypothetical protein
MIKMTIEAWGLFKTLAHDYYADGATPCKGLACVVGNIDEVTTETLERYEQALTDLYNAFLAHGVEPATEDIMQ